MFIVNVAINTEKIAAEKLRDMLVKHQEWFLEQAEQKNFLLVGPYMDWEAAGIIIARTMKREELEAILAQDVFHADGLASYDVHEFKAVKILPAILKEQV